MRISPRSYLGFNLSTLHAEIAVNYADFERNSNGYESDFLIVPKRYRRSSSPQAVFEQGIVEHEFFHARHLMGSTIGWTLYVIERELIRCRQHLAETINLEQLVKDRASFLHEHYNYRKAGYNYEYMRLFVFFTSLKQLLLNGDESEIDTLNVLISSFESEVRLRSTSDRQHNKLLYTRELQNSFPFSVLPNFAVPSITAVSSQTLTLKHLIEGVAAWKEYATVSQLAWQCKRDNFTQIVDNWVKSSLKGDLIFPSQSGHGLSYF